MYSYPKEGQQAMGPRDDSTSSVISLGQTFHFKLHSFMYESKKNGDSVFPEDIDVIPEGSLVEIMIPPDCHYDSSSMASQPLTLAFLLQTLQRHQKQRF